MLERRARRRALRRGQRARRRLAFAVAIAGTLSFSLVSLAVMVAQLERAATAWQHLQRQPHGFAPVVPAGQPRGFRCPVPSAARPILARAAAASGLSPALLVALVKVESNFDSAALSRAGAEGMFQLMPETAAALHVDRADPAANAVAGADYLRQLLARFRRLDLALAAYNAGPTLIAHTGAAPTLDVLRYTLTIEHERAQLTGCSLTAAPLVRSPARRKTEHHRRSHDGTGNPNRVRDEVRPAPPRRAPNARPPRDTRGPETVSHRAGRTRRRLRSTAVGLLRRRRGPGGYRLAARSLTPVLNMPPVAIEVSNSSALASSSSVSFSDFLTSPRSSWSASVRAVP